MRVETESTEVVQIMQGWSLTSELPWICSLCVPGGVRWRLSRGVTERRSGVEKSVGK